MREQPLIEASEGRQTIASSIAGVVGTGALHIDWSGSATLLYGASGDWPANIAQALGHNTPHYLEVADVANAAADERVGTVES